MKTALTAIVGCCLLAINGCSGYSQQKHSSLVLIALHPDGTSAGKKFNVQPDGNAALAITCKGASRTTVIVFAGERLATVFGDPTFLSAEIPARLYGKAGQYRVRLDDGKQESNVLNFEVR